LKQGKTFALAIGRKNYLFCGSHKAALNAAILYSFFGSCKMQNMNPREKLEDTLKRIPEHSILNLEELLPGFQQKSNLKFLGCLH